MTKLSFLSPPWSLIAILPRRCQLSKSSHGRWEYPNPSSGFTSIPYIKSTPGTIPYIKLPIHIFSFYLISPPFFPINFVFLSTSQTVRFSRTLSQRFSREETQEWTRRQWIGKHSTLLSSISPNRRIWLRTHSPLRLRLLLLLLLRLVLSLLLRRCPLRLTIRGWSSGGSDGLWRPVTLTPPSISYVPTRPSSSTIIGFSSGYRSRWACRNAPLGCWENAGR